MLVAGLHALAGRRAALIGGVLLSTNYVFVMWNRAALLESPMIGLIVAAWGAYALAGKRPAMGALAGLFAVLAWFTKAAAAFFLAALVLDALWTLWLSRRPPAGFGVSHETAAADPRPALWTLAGIGLSAALIGLVFVLPNWSEYQFYNWQMTVTRKPSYTLKDFVDRASWLPIVHSLFTRTWLIVSGGSLALMAIVLGWQTAKPGERLLALWVVLGFRRAHRARLGQRTSLRDVHSGVRRAGVAACGIRKDASAVRRAANDRSVGGSAGVSAAVVCRRRKSCAGPVSRPDRRRTFPIGRPGLGVHRGRLDAGDDLPVERDLPGVCAARVSARPWPVCLSRSPSAST